MICNKVQEKFNTAFNYLLKKHELNDIKVKHLIEYANVSRSTFYSNFDNIEGFIRDQIDNLFRLIHNDVTLFRKNPHSSSCVYKSLSEVLFKNRDFVKALYNSRYKQELLDNIYYIFDERLGFCFISNSCSPEKLAMKKIFLFSGYKGFIEKYIETDDDFYLKESACMLQETIECYSYSCKHSDD